MKGKKEQISITHRGSECWSHAFHSLTQLGFGCHALTVVMMISTAIMFYKSCRQKKIIHLNIPLTS